MDNIPLKSIIRIPLREMDIRFVQLQKLIDAKKKMLSDKHKKLMIISKQNHFLETVKNDYNKYHNYINQQKMDQIKALQMLDEYITDLTISGNLTKHNMEDAKEEQNKILREVRSIKKSLDSIIDNTNDIENIMDEKKKHP